MRNAIGIDLSSHGIRLVQVARGRGKLHLRALYATDVESGVPSGDHVGLETSLVEAIRKAHLKSNAALVVGLPYEKVFFGRLRAEIAKPQDMRRLLKFELEDDLPVPFDDLVADLCSQRPVGEGRHEYLIAAVSHEEIGRWTHAFDRAGRRCSTYSTDVCALAAVARLVRSNENAGPVMAAHVDGRRMILALLQGEAILCARHAGCAGDAETIGRTLAREIELTWRGTLGRPQPAGEVLLSGPDELVRELTGRLSQGTGHAVRALGPVPLSPTAGAAELDGRFAVALGLALIGLDSTGGALNFLTADLSQVDRAAHSGAKQAALVCAVLLAALLGLVGLRTFQKWRSLEAERAGTAREIRAVYTDAFSEDQTIVDEAAQMKEHLEALRKEHTMLASLVGKRVPPLRMLHILSEKMTSEKGIGISSFSIKDKTIRLAGTGDTFEVIEQFLEELRRVPEFSSIELEDMTQSRGTGRPEFRLLILVKTG